MLTIVAGQELYASLQAEKVANVSKTALGYNSEQLCELQRKQSARGILGAEIVKSIHGYGLRYDSGLQDFGIIRSSFQLEGSLEAAEQYAAEWVQQDPERRYAWIRDTAKA